jgi:hypothetical protein
VPRAAVLALALLVACGSSEPARRPLVEVPPQEKQQEPVDYPPLPKLVGAVGTLRGVDTSTLSEREKLTHWELVNVLYAPCSDHAVSIAACVNEGRACAACVPAAQLLAEKVHDGATRAEGEKIFKLRFGPQVSVSLADSPTRGDASAAATIVVWSDPQCPACKRAMPEIDKVLAPFGTKVRLVHKLYPLTVHKFGEPAARAALAAFLQGKYWEMEKELFDHQDKAEDADLLDHARSVKLDITRFNKDRAGARVTGILADHRTQGDTAGLDGTPFILVNGRNFDLHFFSWKDLRPWLETDLALAGR